MHFELTEFGSLDLLVILFITAIIAGLNFFLVGFIG